MESSKSFGRKHEVGSSTPPSITCQDPSSHDKNYFLRRKKVKQALTTFRDLSHKLFCQYKSDQLKHLKAKTKALTEAAMLMKEKHNWENTQKLVGHVAGIEVGDMFQYRTELNVIGLHHQFSSGIDYIGKGKNSLATSIVVSNRYANAMKSSGCLVYIGHGGNPNIRSNNLPHDQKLEGGNLALKNSINAKSPVRVILKVYGNSDRMEKWSNNNTTNCSYIYDGLYLVDKMTKERGQFGKLVFKFTLNRIPDQPLPLTPWDVVMERRLTSSHLQKRHKSKSHVVHKDVVRINDISEGKEKFPIRVVTPMSCVQIPPSFDYLVNMVYPEKLKNNSNLRGCDCVDACVDCQKCVCIVKNGGIMPYDYNKRLASPMKQSFIYECGPSCKCLSSCINRVSQFGIQFQLEIFKTELKDWGVRTRSFIPSGSFVCELIGEVRALSCHSSRPCSRSPMGEVHHNREAESTLLVVDYIFNIGAGKGFIDATKHGNIGRFINHSCSPNLCVKDVMYDHNDESIPHKMLFAVKDIPSGRELSYDYNSCKWNIKVGSSNCYCGSAECNGQICT